jgi:hypothetical protein
MFFPPQTTPPPHSQQTVGHIQMDIVIQQDDAEFSFEFVLDFGTQILKCLAVMVYSGCVVM